MSYDATPAPPPPIPHEHPQPVAHWLHTVGLFALLVLTTLFTHHRAAGPVIDEPRIPRYLSSILLEWILLGLVIAGIYRRREFLREAFLNRANSWLEMFGLGFLVYLMGTFAIIVAGGLLYFTPLFHKRNEAVILAMAPHTPREFAVWFFVSLSAGVCEELIFRGYLMRQLTAWTKSSITGVLLAALIFGSVHLYEGPGAIIPLAALALVYGCVVRYYKGDLRAVIVAHTLQDFLVAFIILAKPYLERYQPKP